MIEAAVLTLAVSSKLARGFEPALLILTVLFTIVTVNLSLIATNTIRNTLVDFQTPYLMILS